MCVCVCVRSGLHGFALDLQSGESEGIVGCGVSVSVFDFLRVCVCVCVSVCVFPSLMVGLSRHLPVFCQCFCFPPVFVGVLAPLCCGVLCGSMPPLSLPARRCQRCVWKLQPSCRRVGSGDSSYLFTLPHVPLYTSTPPLHTAVAKTPCSTTRPPARSTRIRRATARRMAPRRSRL